MQEEDNLLGTMTELQSMHVYTSAVKSHRRSSAASTSSRGAIGPADSLEGGGGEIVSLVSQHLQQSSPIVLSGGGNNEYRLVDFAATEAGAAHLRGGPGPVGATPPPLKSMTYRH